MTRRLRSSETLHDTRRNVARRRPAHGNGCEKVGLLLTIIGFVASIAIGWTYAGVIACVDQAT